MKILEEFWYGNIEPTDYDTSSCKEYKKLQELICWNEEKLRVAMTDEQKALFEKYTDCVREHQTITECLIFQNSFKLGARMMLEVMKTLVTASVLKLREPFYSSLPVTTNSMWWTSILTMDGLVRILTDQHFSE